MYKKIDEKLLKNNYKSATRLTFITFFSALILGLLLSNKYVINFLLTYDLVLFISSVIITLSVAFFFKINNHFSKDTDNILNVFTILFILICIITNHIFTDKITNNHLNKLYSNYIFAMIWMSFTLNHSFLYIEKKSQLNCFLCKEIEVSKTEIMLFFITLVSLLSLIGTWPKYILVCVQLMTILFLVNEIETNLFQFTKQNNVLLLLYSLLFFASIHLACIVINFAPKNNLMSELATTAALGVISLRNYYYLLNEFNKTHSLSMELARKMGELSMMHIEAQKAHIAKESFLATMSHEIRTPVNGIIGHAELIASTDIDEEQKRLLGMITISSNNLMKLIDEVLDLPNLISGQIRLNVESVSIYNLIESVLDVVTPKSFEKGLELTYFIEPSIPQFLFTDQKRVGQILLNLANNALKFTDKGEVFIGVTQIDKPNNDEVELLFEVKDTGVGIPPDKIKKLFKAYTQTDASISRKYGGTGLGLAISAQLIQLMGGKIWVESTVGKGTRFVFKIKLKISHVENYVNPIEKELESLKGIKCLVISENPTMRYILARRFKQWKMFAKIVSRFDEAFNYMGVEEFQLLIVDIVSDSKKAFMFLKGNFINPSGRIPSIAFINLGKNANPELPKIVNLCIPKPLKAEILAKKINEFFKNKNLQKQPYQILISEMQSNITTEAKQNKEYNNILEILVAEDNPVNQKLIVSVLKKMGHKVTLVENGALAVEEEKNKTYDVVLMDLQMPVMDGINATRNIISNAKERKRPKIIALTANAMAGDKERCLNAGMDDYMSKPIQIKNLNEKLSQVLPNKKLVLTESAGAASPEKPIEAKKDPVAIPPVESPAPTEKPVYKILVAEDNPVNQKLITSVLKKLGHNVTLVENGALAVEAATKESFELIIMDLQMPVMDGLEASRQIKASPEISPKPIIIALTANAMDGDKERCLNAGMDDYMTKPLQIKLLSETLNKWKKNRAA